MNISERLRHTADMLEDCNSMIDVGTDHAYIPIYLVEKGAIKTAIASDIKEGPLRVAEKNIKKYGYSDKISTRLGGGLSTIKPAEVEVAVIAGMGGNMINDIIENDLETACSMKRLILQPVQYPEITRKYLLEKGFSIIDEDIVKDENKFYFIIKASTGRSLMFEKEAMYYCGSILLKRKNPILLEYINFKIEQLSDILKGLDKSTQEKKYVEIDELVSEFIDLKREFINN